MNDNQTSIQTLSFSLSGLKRWCAEKGGMEVGRSGQAWNCPVSNYLAETVCPDKETNEGAMTSRAYLVCASGIFHLAGCDGQGEVKYFCPQIVQRIIAVADCIPEGTIWTGGSFYRALTAAGL